MAEKESLRGVDLFKFIFSLMIVAMHANILNPESLFQYKVQLTVFALAVPYFFICTGYFAGRHHRGIPDLRSNIMKNIYRFMKLFLIFGGGGIFSFRC